MELATEPPDWRTPGATSSKRHGRRGIHKVHAPGGEAMAVDDRLFDTGHDIDKRIAEADDMGGVLLILPPQYR